jgi:hypothetical protein
MSKVLVLSTFSYYHVAWDPKHGKVGKYERYSIQGIANVKDASKDSEPGVRLICHPGPAVPGSIAVPGGNRVVYGDM